MGKKAKAPPPVDYLGAAKQQGIENRQTALTSSMLSNPNMRTAYGTRNVSYSLDPTTGNYVPTITDELTPEAQQAFNAQQRVDLALSNLAEQGVGTVKDVMRNPFQYTGPNIQTSLNMGNAPALQGGLNLSGLPSVRSSLGNTGQIQTGLDASGLPQLQTGLNLGDAAKMPINAGTTAQQAIMARLQPQLEQEKSALQTQLANQGLTPGSEAYNRAMTEQGQRENDLMSQAALQGINLDMAAQQQAYNQAVTSGQFGNQAQQQAYQQELLSGQFGNQAQQQAFAQELAGAGLSNEAQQQMYQQALMSGQFGNAARSQALNEALQSGQFANTAGEQEFQRQLGLYNLPLQQVLGLMSGSQIQIPQFGGYQGQNINPANIFGATQAQSQDALNRYNAEQAGYNATTGGLTSLAGSGMMAAAVL